MHVHDMVRFGMDETCRECNIILLALWRQEHTAPDGYPHVTSEGVTCFGLCMDKDKLALAMRTD